MTSKYVSGNTYLVKKLWKLYLYLVIIEWSKFLYWWIGNHLLLYQVTGYNKLRLTAVPWLCRKLGISTIPKSASGEDRYYSFMGTGNWFGIYLAMSIVFLHQCKYAAVDDVFWLSLTHINSVDHWLPKKRNQFYSICCVSYLFRWT